MFYLVLLGGIITFFPGNQVKAENNEIYVDGSYTGYSDGSAEKPYTSIQQAIDLANDGDTIYVFGGTYDETLIVNKKIKLWGSIDGKPTIIDTRADKRYTVEITADYAEIQDFTISDRNDHKTSPIGALIAVKADNVIVQGNTLNDTKSWGIYLHPQGNGNVISANFINNTARGIYADNSDTNDIFNNIVANCSEYGIQITSSANNRLYKNYVSNCTHGIYLQQCTQVNISSNSINTTTFHGVYIEQSTGGTMRYNTLKNNDGVGIYLNGDTFILSENIFDHNERGLTLVGSSNIIRNNSFSNSSASGVYTLPSSKNNIIYLNDFKNNGKNAQENGDNQWYYGTQGNYWDDYNNVDRNIDGVGDTPYIKNGVVDEYPLGYFLKPPKKPENPSPEDTATGVGLKITFKVDVEDPDSDYLTVYFYRADTNALIGTDKKVPAGGTAECTFTQPFDTTFAWYAIVNDSLLENQSDTWFFTTMTTPPNNKPPTADAGGPYAAAPGEIISFDASNSSDPDGKIDFYRWNFGDGTSEILAETPQHIYEKSGEYTVTLTVIDNNGTTDTDIITVSISGQINKKPIADPDGPYTGKTGSEIVFLGVNSTDEDGSITNYTWYLGDGTTAYGMIVTHTYTEPGSYLIMLTVTDDQGKTDTAQTLLTIEKASPQTPGFELFILLIAITLMLRWRKKVKTRDSHF